MSTVTDRLREVIARGRAGRPWSQRGLSMAAGLSPAAVGWILSNPESATGADTLEKIARAAKVSPSWLTYGTGSPDDTDDTQSHPPDEIPPADRRPVSHDATRSSRPELRNHVLWPELESGARAKAAETGRVFPEWAWDATARAQLVITGTPDVAGVYDLVKLHFEKGWGRPREERAETEPQSAVKKSGTGE